MTDRPAWHWTAPWGMPIEEQREAAAAYVREFKEFIRADLALRFAQLGARNADLFSDIGNVPPPADRRRKPVHERALDPVELAARAVPLIRDIFEDYWTEGRDAGRVYRGHDPSAEEMAAEFGGVSLEDVEQRLKRATDRRPPLK